jgi:hypothetical protein
MDNETLQELIFEDFKKLGYEISAKIGKTDYLMQSPKSKKWV